MHSSLSGSAASLSVFPQDPLARGSANISASASNNGLRMSSESGSGIQTPSPEVKGIIRDLLSGRLDQAAISFQSVYRGPNAMTTPRGGGSPLPLIKPQEATPAEMVLSSALQHATQLLAARIVHQSMKGVMGTTQRRSSSAPLRMQEMRPVIPPLMPFCGCGRLSSLQQAFHRKYLVSLD